MRRIATACVVCICASVLAWAHPAAASTTTIEDLLLKQINTGRARVGQSALVMHAGLLARAREHSSAMARTGSLNHDGFADRVNGASPDPSETNGKPDDGFNVDGACENVAMRLGPGESDAQTAATIYNGWLNSAPHRHCMLDEGAKHTVAGLGIARASDGAYWATLEAVFDKTLPKAQSSSPGKPSFSKDDPCGQTVQPSVIGGPDVVELTSVNSRGGRVTMKAVSIPSWATFRSTPGSKAVGTLTAAPGLLDWVSDVLGADAQATISATNASHVTVRCTFKLSPALL